MVGIDDRELDEVLYSPVCIRCAHLIDVVEHRCKAFKRIPDVIWRGDNDHTKRYPGDYSIQFKAKRRRA